MDKNIEYQQIRVFLEKQKNTKYSLVYVLVAYTNVKENS
jgi:hypothetical protein|tara:strand:+ start:883 stop:999 length:117 start_codon:yes stop_codon:yes gene_type:complete